MVFAMAPVVSLDPLLQREQLVPFTVMAKCCQTLLPHETPATETVPPASLLFVQLNRKVLVV
jgi:hypothetical protein